MPKATRTQLAKILKEVTVTRNAEAFAVNEAARKNILAAGGKIRTLSPQQRQEWVNAMKPVWGKFEKDIGKDTIASAQAMN